MQLESQRQDDGNQNSSNAMDIQKESDANKPLESLPTDEKAKDEPDNQMQEEKQEKSPQQDLEKRNEKVETVKMSEEETPKVNNHNAI